MKNKIYSAIGIAIILLIYYIPCLVLACYTPTTDTQERAQTYTLTTHVVNVDAATQAVSVIDSTGNVWSYYDTDAATMHAGDAVVCVMDTQGTATVYDDVIISAQAQH